MSLIYTKLWTKGWSGEGWFTREKWSGLGVSLVHSRPLKFQPGFFWPGLTAHLRHLRHLCIFFSLCVSGGFFEPSLYHHIQNTTNTNSGPAIQSSVCQSAIGDCFHHTIPTLLWHQCVYIISYTHFYRPFNTSLHRLNCWTRAQWLRSFFSCSNYTLGMFGPSFRRRFNVHI